MATCQKLSIVNIPYLHLEHRSCWSHSKGIKTKNLSSRSLTARPWKWWERKTSLSFWDGIFSGGELLNFQGLKQPIWKKYAHQIGHVHPNFWVNLKQNIYLNLIFKCVFSKSSREYLFQPKSWEPKAGAPPKCHPPPQEIAGLIKGLITIWFPLVRPYQGYSPYFLGGVQVAFGLWPTPSLYPPWTQPKPKHLNQASLHLQAFPDWLTRNASKLHRGPSPRQGKHHLPRGCWSEFCATTWRFWEKPGGWINYTPVNKHGWLENPHFQ